MTTIPFRRTLARALLLATVVLSLPLPAAAGGDAVFVGRVMQPDGLTPRSGVVVRLLDPSKETSFPSAPTNEQGRFRIDGAPKGTYVLVADTDEGAYVATDEFRVAPGDNPPMQLTLQSRALASNGPGSSGGTAGAKGLPKAIKGVVAGILVLAAFFAFDSNTEDVASDNIPF